MHLVQRTLHAVLHVEVGGEGLWASVGLCGCLLRPANPADTHVPALRLELCW